MLPISLKLWKITSGDFHCCIFLKLLFQSLHFWTSTAHDHKAHFVTSQKSNLRIQIGQVLQFYVH